MMWHFGSLDWQPGTQGKGNVYSDGDVSTWTIDDEGSPHHQEQANEDGKQPVFLFYISPDGAITDGGLDFNNTSDSSDDEMVQHILSVCDQLRDGRFEADLDIPDVAPRYQDESGGYGHAWNFLTKRGATEDELHVALALPQHIIDKIHEWAKDVDWPNGTELEKPEDYHITLLYCPEGHEEHRDAEWLRHSDGYDVEITGLDEFGEGDEIATVLRIDAPAAKDHANDLQDMAENRGLPINRFPGGYKPHITVAYGPGKPKNVRVPKLKFKSEPSSVSKPRVSSTWQEPTPGLEDVEQPQSTIVEELRSWLNSFDAPSATVAPISIHHDSVQDLIPSGVATPAQGHAIDPPAHPYEPYDWAKEGSEAHQPLREVMKRKKRDKGTGPSPDGGGDASGDGGGGTTARHHA